MRCRILALLAGVVVVFVAAGFGRPSWIAQDPRPIVAGSSITFEPVVVFNITGGTLTGTVHRQLAVYNNGFVTISKFDNQYFPTQQVIKDVQTASISSRNATKLLYNLIDAGAASLSDQRLAVADIPLNTLTIFVGAENAHARTFSYWVGFGAYAGVNRVINQFVQRTFPGF